MNRRPDSDLKPLGRVISESLDAGFLGLAKEMVRVFEVWGAAVGPYNAKRTRPESIQNGRLTVVVESPVWIDHLSYFKNEFIKNINEALKAPIVEEIIFRVGIVGAGDSAGGVSRPLKAPAKDKAGKVSPTMRSALNTVKDKDLKSALVKLLSHQNADPKE